MNSGIYQIQNSLNGKRYIGSAVKITRRWAEHKTQLRRNIHNNAHLQRSWNKHGEKSFVFSTLLNCSDDRLLIHEQGALNALRPEFNIATNAKSPMLGRSHSLETRIKLGTNFRGRTHTPEAKRKISEAAKHRTASLETRVKLSLSLFGNSRALGYKQSAETKSRVVAAPRTPEARLKHREAMAKPETRMKISKAALGNIRRIGKKHSEESIAKMAVVRLAYWHNKKIARANMIG